MTGDSDTSRPGLGRVLGRAPLADPSVASPARSAVASPARSAATACWRPFIGSGRARASHPLVPVLIKETSFWYVAAARARSGVEK